ncbi:MAG TPA: DoxX family protein [Phycisphaerales bacterium]|nr:DoxX family protein [Phycisphaerales bacterium]
MSEPNESGVAGGTSRKLAIAGWVVGVLPMAMLTLSSVMKFLAPPQAVDGFKHLGWNPSDAVVLGVVELSCVVLYLVPRTCVLGAILVTGYLGGAVATHARLGEAWVIPVALGVAAWLGLVLRDTRLRALLPLRG